MQGCLFQPPESWRTPRRQQRGWGSQPSSFRSVKTASRESLLFGTGTNPSAENFLCHFRTSEVSCYLTISSAGIVFSRVAGTRGSSCSTHTPASTGEKGLQGNTGPLCPSQGGVWMEWFRDQRPCFLGFSDISHSKLAEVQWTSYYVWVLWGFLNIYVLHTYETKCFYIYYVI